MLCRQDAYSAHTRKPHLSYALILFSSLLSITRHHKTHGREFLLFFCFRCDASHPLHHHHHRSRVKSRLTRNHILRNRTQHTLHALARCKGTRRRQPYADGTITAAHSTPPPPPPPLQLPGLGRPVVVPTHLLIVYGYDVFREKEKLQFWIYWVYN